MPSSTKSGRRQGRPAKISEGPPPAWPGTISGGLLFKRKCIDRLVVISVSGAKDDVAECGCVDSAGAALAFEAEACVFDIGDAGFSKECAIKDRCAVDLHGLLRGEGGHGETTGRMP